MTKGNDYVASVLQQRKSQLVHEYQRVVHCIGSASPVNNNILALEEIQQRIKDLDYGVEIISII